ncbi:MAG: hypothetical protein V7K67_21505 [Nostoc sp.]|uniref:hypothetical protein n=1 Tax=Nostoc sp. TaxID=1180 RepID=UPI002FF4E0B9
MEAIKPSVQVNGYEARLTELLQQRLSIQLQIDALQRECNVTQSLVSHFQQFLEQKRSEVQAKTFRCKYLGCRKWVQGILGDSTSLLDFDVNYAREIVNNLKHGRKLSTVKGRLQVFALFWDWMQPSNDTPINPWRIAMKGLYADDVRVDSVFSDRERSLVLDVMTKNEEYKDWCNLMDFSMQIGCTPLQALSLTWDDIDLSRALVTFSCCCDRQGYGKPSARMPDSVKALLEPMLLEPCTDIDGNVFTLKTDQSPSYLIGISGLETQAQREVRYVD